MTISIYTADRHSDWDSFVRSSRNATFLFERGYMDYHADRFRDHSLIISDRGRTVALLPANITDDAVLHTHEGLTYGGLLLPSGHYDGDDVMRMFDAIIDHCRQEGMKAIDYKPLPWIYAAQPSQEDLYALFRLGAVRTRCELSSAINLRANPGFNTQMRRHLRKALIERSSEPTASTPSVLTHTHGVEAASTELTETSDIPVFWEMLSECLTDRHSAAPVHTANELALLKSRFPDNIRYFVIRYEGKMSAGMCIYDTGRVAHTQYIATTAEGRKQNLLPLLTHRLIHKVFADRDYFDFGTSNEDAGMTLNAGLLRQKFSFGATGVAHERYLLTL